MRCFGVDSCFLALDATRSRENYASVSEPLLRGLGYTLDSFMARTGGSLRNMFYGEGASFFGAGPLPADQRPR